MPRINSEFAEIRERCGDAVADILIEKCGGVNVYIPMKENRRAVNLRYIRDHYDGRNIGSIARHLKMSRRAVMAMLDEKIDVGDVQQVEDVKLPRIYTGI